MRDKGTLKRTESRARREREKKKGKREAGGAIGAEKTVQTHFRNKEGGRAARVGAKRGQASKLGEKAE